MIAEVLGTGKASARTSAEIEAALGISHRDLLQAVECERRAGEPICAGSGAVKGYYLADGPGEMLEFCGYLFRRFASGMKTYRACKATAERMAAAK